MLQPSPNFVILHRPPNMSFLFTMMLCILMFVVKEFRFFISYFLQKQLFEQEQMSSGSKVHCQILVLLFSSEYPAVFWVSLWLQSNTSLVIFTLSSDVCNNTWSGFGILDNKSCSQGQFSPLSHELKLPQGDSWGAKSLNATSL
jgi:hypothetical protein